MSHPDVSFLLMSAMLVMVLVLAWPLVRVARLLFAAMTPEERALSLLGVMVIFGATVAFIAAALGLL